jgi:lipopolysaccharide transport protein LptA
MCTVFCSASRGYAAPPQKAKPKTSPTAPANKAPVTSKKSAATPTPKPVAGFNSDSFNLSKEPTNISAQTLTLLTDKRTFTYQGSVVVVQGDMTLTSDYLDGSYSENNEIEKIVARSNVHIVKGPDIKASGQRADYDAVKRTIIMTESPRVEQKGSILTADVIRIFVDENRSVAEGNVKVTLINTGDGAPGVP